MAKKLPPLPSRSDQAARVGRSPGEVFAPLADTGRLRTVAIDKIVRDPNQPRQKFDAEALKQLAASIEEHGVLQPPVVRPPAEDGTVQIVAGERRWRAAKLAGKTRLEVLVRDADGSAALELAVLENVAREPLTPIEEARAYATLVDDLGTSVAEVGRKVGKSRSYISNHIRLLNLSDEILAHIDAGRLTFAHGRLLLQCEDVGERRKLARRAVAESWTTRRLEEALTEKPRSPTPRRAAAVSADLVAFADRLTDRISAVSGLEVVVAPTRKQQFTFTVTGQDAARALASRMGVEVEEEEAGR